jgi:penicillin-binding protein 2
MASAARRNSSGSFEAPRSRAVEPSEDVALHGRLLGLFAFASLMAGVVLLRLWWLTIHQGEEWLARAEANFLQPSAIDPPRGVILDRHGEPLAVNQPSYDIGLVRYRQRDADLLKALRRIEELAPPGSRLPLPDDVLSSRPAWKEKRLLSGLSPEEALPILEAMGEWEFLRASPRHKRFYPLGRAAAHALGYLRGAPAGREEEFAEKGYRPEDLIGWTGVEAAWEESLRGDLGREVRERDALNREHGVDLEQPAIPGATLYLALDARVQRAAYDAIGGRRAAAIAIDPRSGGIIALVSSPSFDPNTRALEAGDSELNRATSTALAPASTFKVFSAVAMLENGIPSDGTYYCGGYHQLPNWKPKFYCDHRAGCGTVDLAHMLKVSCNVFAYKGADKLGAHRLIEVYERFGFGRPTGLMESTLGEANGALPSPNSMSRGETILAGIGQGRVTVSPIQMAVAMGAIANGGMLYRPWLAERLEDIDGDAQWKRQPDGQRIRFERSHRARLLEGMRLACQERGGTAFGAGFDPAWDVAGKTGSAQRKTISDAWFAGFAPARDPEIVVVVRVEESGGGGAQAAPVAKKMLEAWFSEGGEEFAPSDASERREQMAAARATR